MASNGGSRDAASVGDGNLVGEAFRNLPAPIPPSVTIVNPPSGVNFRFGNTIVIFVEAMDDGVVTQVKIFSDSTFLGMAALEDGDLWGFDWANALVGLHSLTTVVYDDRGLSTTSDPVSIEVLPGDYKSALDEG